MLPRPRIRLPLWGAGAIVLTAYVIRSVARGLNFRPDMPADAIVLALFVIVLAGVAWLRRQPPLDEDERTPPAQNAERDSPADKTEEPGR